MLFKKVPGLTTTSVMYDWMHCKHLGTDQIQLGSVLYILIFHVMGGLPKDNLKSTWSYMKTWYKQHACKERYSSFSKLTMFVNVKKKTSPKLRGKAAQVCALIPCLLDLWTERMDAANPIHKKVKTLLKLSNSLETILGQNKEELALSSDAPLFKQFAFGMAQIHRELCLHFQDQTPCLFPEIPKIHMLLHVAQQCDQLNPRLTWCYKGEDFMGVHRNLAKSCATRLEPPQVCEKMLLKMRVALHLQLVKKEKMH